MIEHCDRVEGMEIRVIMGSNRPFIPLSRLVWPCLALDGHVQHCVVKVTWLTSVCTGPNNESDNITFFDCILSKILRLKCNQPDLWVLVDFGQVR